MSARDQDKNASMSVVLPYPPHSKLEEGLDFTAGGIDAPDLDFSTGCYADCLVTLTSIQSLESFYASIPGYDVSVPEPGTLSILLGSLLILISVKKKNSLKKFRFQKSSAIQLHA